MDKKPSQPPKWMRQVATALVAALVLAVPIYVLSIGPVCALRVFSHATLATAYRPLMVIVERSETAGQWYLW